MAQHAYLTKKTFFHNRNDIFIAFFSALFKPLFLVDCQRYRFEIKCHESSMSDLDMIYYQTFPISMHIQATAMRRVVCPIYGSLGRVLEIFACHLIESSNPLHDMCSIGELFLHGAEAGAYVHTGAAFNEAIFTKK